MTTIGNAAHELRIALQDSGLVWDGVTGSADDWPEEAEALIAEHIKAVIADAQAAESRNESADALLRR